MANTMKLILALATVGMLSGCAALVGAAGIVLVDESMEQSEGGDGLF